MLKFLKIFFFVIVLTAVCALSVSASAEFPVIDESGEIAELKGFYCPSASENVVDAFLEDANELGASESAKFSVSATQGGGKYISEVFRREGFEFAGNSVKLDHYFSVINFSGDSITVNVAPNTDVENGYAVYSNKGAVSATFSDGVLSFTVNQAQLIKVVFDDSVGKTIYIFVGYKNFIEVFDVEMLLESGVSSIVSQGSKGNATYTYQLKTFIDNNAVYYPAISVGSDVYVSEELYNGTYSGNDAVNYKGDKYLPINSFVGNGNIESVTYDEIYGAVRFTAKSSESASLSNFKNAADTSLTDKNGSLTFFDKSATDSNGILTEIDPALVRSADSLKFSTKVSMNGKASGVKVKVALLGYNTLGETEVVSETNIRAYMKEYDTSVYFDVSADDCDYESWYLAIIIEEDPGVWVTMSDIKLEIFDVSSGIGDNEFNPF